MAARTITIQNNTIGLDRTYQTRSAFAWTITNNKLFQTATRIYTTSNTHNGINVAVGSGYTITGNTIGFADSAGNGTTNIVGNKRRLPAHFLVPTP